MFAPLLVAVVLAQPARIEATTPYFEAHSGFWQNLHHVLYELGRRQRVAQGAELWGPPPVDLGTPELSVDEQKVWQRAVDHYAKTWVEKDLLFDEQLFLLKGVLANHEDDAELEDPAVPPDTLAVLNEVAPLYRRTLWPKHDAHNRAWFAERAGDVSAHGPAIVPLLEKAFDAKFPKEPIRVDVVAVANWGGAYTTTKQGVHVVASSMDPRDQGRAGTEILFHESAHAMTDAVMKALGPTAPKNLWHVVLFFTVGEACRRVWPDYVPYMEANGVFADELPAVKEVWATRLDGKPSLQTAADRLLKRVGAPDPDVVAARGQTVVTGSRTERRLEDAVVATEVINRQQIESIGATTLQQLLLQQPGVEIEYSFRGAGISLQGLGPEYVLVLIDGERQTGRVGNVLDLYRYSLRDVERIEIIKGPAAALYGSDAIGGVINLITRRPQRPLELQGRVQGGLTNAPQTGIKADMVDARAHAGSKLRWFEARGGVGYQSQGPYDWNTTDAATSGAGFWRWDVDGMVAADIAGKARVSLRGDYMRRDLNAVDTIPGGANFDRRQRSEQFGLTLRLDAKPAERTKVALWGRTALYRDQLQQDQRGSAAMDAYTASLDRIYSVDAQLDHQIDNNTVTVGAQFLTESLFSSRLSKLGDRYRVGIFAQDEYDVPYLGDVKLKLLPGLRVDIDSQFGSAPTPRLAMKLDPHPRVTLRASYGWGFRAPSFQELYLLFENTGVGYVVEGNPNLRAEISQAVNVAADVRLPLEGWVASASFFHTALQDLINIDTSMPIDPRNATRFRYENVASAYAQGLEAALRMRLSKGAYFDLTYVLTDARDNVRNGPLAGRAVHKVSAQLMAKYRPTGLEAVVRATYLGPRPFYIGDGMGNEELAWTRGMVNLDIQVTWRPFTWGSIFAGVTNLLNAGDAVYVPQPPRRFLAGIQLEY